MKCWAPPWRFWIACNIFMTGFTNYMLGANLSASIVSMVQISNTTKIAPCVTVREGAEGKKKRINQTRIIPNYGPRYKWSEKQQGNLLAAYFYGYAATVLIGGPTAEMLGAANVILVTSILATILTAIIPPCAQYGIGAIIAIRVLIGIMGGFGYPAMNVIVARWAPPQEKSKFMIAQLGNTIGIVVTWVSVGNVTKNTADWAWGFYVVAMINGVYCVFWGVMVTDTPTKHRWISEEEKKYISDSQAGTLSKKKKVAPFAKIFKSRYFWALAIAQIGSLWCLNLVMTYAPKYMAETQGKNLLESTSLASAPYFARFVCCFCFGMLGDWMRKRKVMTVTHIRKFFIIFAHLLPAVTLWLFKPVNCNWKGALALLCFNQGLNGATIVAHLQNPQDLAPNFAGTVFGLMHFLGCLTGFIVPLISAALLEYYGYLDGPVYIFMIGGIVTFFCGSVFILFGTAELQPWNNIEEEPKPEATTAAT